MTQSRSTTAQSKSPYNWQWQKARKNFLLRNDLCVHCLEAGVITAANEVDHIKAHKGDSFLFWDESNWQALCKSCHSQKTAHEDREFKSRVPPFRHRGGEADGLPRDPKHHWNTE